MFDVTLTPPVAVKFKGITVWMNATLFESLVTFRRQKIDSHMNCFCGVDTGVSYRASYFGMDEPTELVEFGELDPTEMATHVQVTSSIRDMFGDDPFNFWTWRSATGKQMQKHTTFLTDSTAG